MKETKIFYNYICDQLEAIEESYEVEKMTTQALESMINCLVLDLKKQKL